MANYPLRLYVEKVKLWLLITDLDMSKIGPTIVGRLKGASYRLAMKITVPRQDGTILRGPDAVSAEAEVAQMTDGGYPIARNHCLP